MARKNFVQDSSKIPKSQSSEFLPCDRLHGYHGWTTPTISPNLHVSWEFSGGPPKETEKPPISLDHIRGTRIISEHHLYHSRKSKWFSIFKWFPLAPETKKSPRNSRVHIGWFDGWRSTVLGGCLTPAMIRGVVGKKSVILWGKNTRPSGDFSAFAIWKMIHNDPQWSIDSG